jgi:broad specificity phosphatase PhoE
LALALTADGDVLTLEGVRAAVAIGSRLEGSYEVLVSSGAQRATQTLACFLAGLGEKVRKGVVVEPALRSGAEERWRAAYEKDGSGALQALREADPELVEEDSAALAAVLGLAGHMVEPISKGGGVLVVEEDGAVRVERLG